ncbi:hypothetical protein ACXET9_14005 [Brachybacterium sp. DNPG3]
MSDLDAVEAGIWARLTPFRDELEEATVYGMPSLRRPGTGAHDCFAAVKRNAKKVSLYAIAMDAWPEVLAESSPGSTCRPASTTRAADRPAGRADGHDGRIGIPTGSISTSTCGSGKYLLASFPRRPTGRRNDTMNTTAAPTETATLQRSLSRAWIGPAAGIACMIVLFVVGLATDNLMLTIMASTMAGVLGSIWAALYGSLRRKLTQAQQR